MLQTDGGPDHSLKRFAAKFALIATFKELDIDHFVILRCAPNGSARNKIERSMSVLNLGVAHVATKRAVMASWAEEAVKNCSTMQSVRDVAKSVEARRLKALDDVEILKGQLNTLAIQQSGENLLCI